MMVWTFMKNQGFYFNNHYHPSLFRNDSKEVNRSSILKRGGNGEANADHEEEEEESAYNEHFKNNSAPPGPGEFRVPSVRVKQGQGAANTANTATDYTGTALAQGEKLSGDSFRRNICLEIPK